LRATGNFGEDDAGVLAWLLKSSLFGGVVRHNKCMVKAVEGIYRNGRVELMEPLAAAEGSRVIVTCVPPPGSIDLRERGIDESQAADLRHRLAPFAEDWDRPEMTAYDELPPRMAEPKPDPMVSSEEEVDVDAETAAAIDHGIVAADEGRVVSNEEVRKLVPKWISSFSTPSQR